jgi:hypothetical protein
VPGEKEGVIEPAVLRAWIQVVRRIGAEADRARVVDQYIGHILAYAPPDKSDGAWPDRAVRVLLEELDSDEVENGLTIERFNMRGVYSKAFYEGGGQERALSQQHRSWAKSAVDWPRTAAMLERIAQGYDHDAEREDIRAQQDKMRF